MIGKHKVFFKYKLHWRIFALVNLFICWSLKDLFQLSWGDTFHPGLLMTSLVPASLVSMKEVILPSGNIFNFWVAYCFSTMAFVLAFLVK